MIDNTTYITIDKHNQNMRVDIALSQTTEFSRSMIQKLIYAQNIKCDGMLVAKANFVTQVGQQYEITQMPANIEHILPEKGELEILFEDEHIIVLNKQAELITHPGAGNPNGTLINRLAYYVEQKKEALSDYNGAQRLGVVHRLDKGVSGCIILAKTNAAHVDLSKQFQERVIQKEYVAICYGKMAQNVEPGCEYNGLMEDYIGRATHDRKKMMCYKTIDDKTAFEKIEEDDCALPTSHKHATMNYKILECFYLDSKHGFISLVQCMPHTGRMHQIRVQLASRKLPIIGDKLYGNKQNAAVCSLLGERIALHARAIRFRHPITMQEMYIETAAPGEFQKIIAHVQGQ